MPGFAKIAGEMINLPVSYRPAVRYANGKTRGTRPRPVHFRKTACIPGLPRYTEFGNGRRNGSGRRQVGRAHLPIALVTCGSSSVVEHHVANVGVEGSNPFSRSET